MLFTAGNIRFNLIQIHRSLDLNGKHYSPLCGTVKDSRTTSALNCIKSSQSAAVCVSPRLVCDWQVSRAFLLHNACFHKDKDLRYKYTHMCSMVCNRTSQHTSNVSTEWDIQTGKSDLQRLEGCSMNRWLIHRNKQPEERCCLNVASKPRWMLQVFKKVMQELNMSHSEVDVMKSWWWPGSQCTMLRLHNWIRSGRSDSVTMNGSKIWILGP